MGTNDERLGETINSDSKFDITPSNLFGVSESKNTDMPEHMSRVKNVHKYRIQEDDSFWG